MSKLTDRPVGAWDMFKTAHICRVCAQRVDATKLHKHKEEHIRRGDVWTAPCKLNGHPARGVCTLRNHYDACQVTDRLKNNWMCWRDGVLFEFDTGPKEARKEVIV